MLEELKIGDFFERVGEGFRVPFAEGSIALTLVEVTNLARADHAGPRRAPFSLIFRGPSAPCLRQRIWPLEHEALGRLDIFLVPIGPDPSGMRYEAVFN
jgi:hypothetical protein